MLGLSLISWHETIMEQLVLLGPGDNHTFPSLTDLNSISLKFCGAVQRILCNSPNHPDLPFDIVHPLFSMP